MKHNIIFVVLTAVILIAGFFIMDVVQYFSNNTETFQDISKGKDNAVYLSANREIIDPMSIITPSDNEISEHTRFTATAIVKAMARHDDITYIAWGTDIPDLSDAWQADENGYIYINKWKYMNYGKKEERLLDCIINPSDYNIVYIRFYCDTEYKVSATEMNISLEKFNSESMKFYTNLEKIELEITDYMEYTGVSEEPLNESEWDFEDNMPYIPSEYYESFFPLTDYIISYTKLKDIIYAVTYSRFATFWISPLGISDVYPTSGVLNQFYINPPLFQPSYSSKDGRIYQTININGMKLTVIYCVTEDIIEGYYFE